MILLSNYVRQGQRVLRRWALDPLARQIFLKSLWVLAGFCCGAASLLGQALPLSICLVWGSSGWEAVLAAVGGAAGYLLFWGKGQTQMQLCLAVALAGALLLGSRDICRRSRLMLPALAALTMAVAGVIFQTAAQSVSAFVVHLTRVGLSFGGTWLVSKVRQRQDPLMDWLACALGVFALAQILPLPYVGLGYAALGALMVAAPFPAVILSALALDLATVTPVAMSAVAALGCLIRLLPRQPPWLKAAVPAGVCAVVMGLTGQPDVMPLPGLFLGSLAGKLLPPGITYHRGHTAVAQVRLEVAAQVLEQTGMLLEEGSPGPVDRDAIYLRAVEQACESCPYRKACRDQQRVRQIPGVILEQPLLYAQDLPVVCHKSGRFLSQLHRAQEQLRSIRADRQLQQEYRDALTQQYGFLSGFLRQLADRLAEKDTAAAVLFHPRVWVFSRAQEGENGDRCLRFAGVEGKYYVLLCDGMGTGSGASRESRRAAAMLRRMLCAGFPPEHALTSLNSICALADRAGAVTVDLVEICLFTGKAVVYKWGAAPSYLISRGGAERIGAVTPPPGLGVTRIHQTSHGVSLRREQILVMVSDGVDSGQALRCCADCVGQTVQQVGQCLLGRLQDAHADDATAVVIQLAHQLPGSE